MKKLILATILLLSIPAFAGEPATNPAPKRSSIVEMLFGGHNFFSWKNLSIEIGGNYIHLSESDWSASRGTMTYRLHYRPLKFLFVYAGIQTDFTKLSLTFPGKLALSPRYKSESSASAIGIVGGRLAVYYCPRFVVVLNGEYEFMGLQHAKITGVNPANRQGDVEKIGWLAHKLTRGYVGATIQFTFGRFGPYLAAGYYWTHLDAILTSDPGKLASLKISHPANTPFVYPGLTIEINRHFSVNLGGIVNPKKNPAYSAHLSFIFNP